MKEIFYIDRESGEKLKEAVYGEKALLFLYNDKWFVKIFSRPILAILCRFHLFSRIYGWIQKKSFTKKKIKPFVQRFDLNEKEFVEKKFTSFNDFFTRKLVPSARPIDSRQDVAVMPADGRYLAYQNSDEIKKIFIKGERFTLSEFLKDEALSEKYSKGPIVIARLCPIDYHRFHFPFDCTPSKSKCINGKLHSVNPIALWENIKYLGENKRVVTKLKSDKFGEVLFVEIGAINVGSIHQTFSPNSHQAKGKEKGYFSFGGSCIVMLFEPGKIKIDQDILDASYQKIEVYSKMGQSLGKLGANRAL